MLIIDPSFHDECMHNVIAVIECLENIFLWNYLSDLIRDDLNQLDARSRVFCDLGKKLLDLNFFKNFVLKE